MQSHHETDRIVNSFRDTTFIVFMDRSLVNCFGCWLSCGGCLLCSYASLMLTLHLCGSNNLKYGGAITYGMSLVFPRVMTIFPKVLASVFMWRCNNLKYGGAIS